MQCRALVLRLLWVYCGVDSSSSLLLLIVTYLLNDGQWDKQNFLIGWLTLRWLRVFIWNASKCAPCYFLVYLSYNCSYKGATLVVPSRVTLYLDDEANDQSLFVITSDTVVTESIDCYTGHRSVVSTQSVISFRSAHFQLDNAIIGSLSWKLHSVNTRLKLILTCQQLVRLVDDELIIVGNG